jgi:hypothetical protein
VAGHSWSIHEHGDSIPGYRLYEAGCECGWLHVEHDRPRLAFWARTHAGGRSDDEIERLVVGGVPPAATRS